MDFSNYNKQYQCTYTGYDGHEDQILELRNRNRKDYKDRKYMDWRYKGQPGAHKPIIAWVLDKDNRQVGMAALIFHPYWIGTKIYHVPQLGDISLDEEHRGKGIGKKLFNYVNSLIQENRWPGALVIPNSLASRGLVATGWKTAELIVSYVFIINPCRYIFKVIRNKNLSNILGGIYYRYIRFKLAHLTSKGSVSHKIDTFGKEYDQFWNKVKKKQVIREKNSEIMNWRYRTYYKDLFEVLRVCCDKKTAGFIVYCINHSEATCYIYDIIVVHEKELKAVFTTFLKEICEVKTVYSVRIMINKNHPYAKTIRFMGFLQRRSINLLQIYNKQNSPFRGSISWSIFSGDKDT